MLRPTLITLGGVLLGSLLVFPGTSIGQENPKGNVAGPRRDSMLDREGDIENRSRRMELLNTPEKVKVLSEDDRKLIASQILEDFERVQVINREMVQAVAHIDNKPYKQLASLSDEMNKRAKRLKINLNIPDVQDDKKEPESSTPSDAAELKISVQTLTGTVKNFVNSPVFTDPKVTTVGHLQNLRRDISTVIELSRTVKKAATKLQDQN